MNNKECQIGKGAKVAVIDDERYKAETVAGIAEEANLEPAIISDGDGPFQEMDHLLRRIQTLGCAAVVCDHRLTGSQFSSFLGAELLATLFSQKIPGLLMSTFAAEDSETSIRRYRAYIPSLVSREKLNPSRMLKYLRFCENEINGYTSPERFAHRVLLRVVGISSSLADNGVLIDTIMHSWNHDEKIQFPLELVDDLRIRKALQEDFKDGVRLFAKVNIDCSDSKDLFFKNFEMAPEPNEDYFTS